MATSGSRNSGSIRISKRTLQMQESPIRKLIPYAEEAKSRGIHVYHVNIGQPDISTPDPFLDAVHGFPRRLVPYSHSQGEQTYLDALVEYYDRCGYGVKKSQINVTTGGSEAIIFAMMVTCDPGDEIIVPEPFYTNYNGFATIAGVRLVPLRTRLEDDFHLPPMEDVEARITGRTRAILLCNPNNPTGTVYTRDELQGLADLAVKHDLFLLSDEVYREFVFDGQKHTSFLEIEGVEQRVVLMDSISKRYSACGARIGALVCKNVDVMAAVLKLAQARLSTAAIEQLAAAKVTTDCGPDYFEEMVEEYRRRRDAMFEILEGIPGVVARKPHGAFYAILQLPVEDAEHFAKWMLTSFAHERETVMVAPASGFYASAGSGKDQVRIAYVLQEKRCRRAMELLAKGLEAYRARRA